MEWIPIKKNDFGSPLAINPNFAKNPIFKNKGLFYAKFCQDLQEIFFMLQKVVGPKN